MTLKLKQKLFPLVKISDLTQTKFFYINNLGWSLALEMPGFLQVHHPASVETTLSFSVAPPAMVQPNGSVGLEQKPFLGQGFAFSVEVPDADQECQRLKEKGIEPIHPLTDQPWGWRSFHIVDPNGIILDLYHPIPPSPEFLRMLKP